MSPKANLLREWGLGSTVLTVTVADRVRARLRDELDVLGMSQRELAEVISSDSQTVWTQSRVGKILTGRVELCVDDVAAIASAIGLTLSEAVRDRGLEFYAEMTPSELRIVEWLRRRPDAQAAILTLLSSTRLPLVKRHKVGRPMNSELPRRAVEGKK